MSWIQRKCQILSSRDFEVIIVAFLKDFGFESDSLIVE
jgi:hypothetical protein